MQGPENSKKKMKEGSRDNQLCELVFGYSSEEPLTPLPTLTRTVLVVL